MKHIVTEHQLPSGARGLVVDVPSSSVINLTIRFNSGFQFADRSHYEVSHLMEHLIACGSQQYPQPGQFKVEFEKNGAYRNAYTTTGVNGYVAECAEFELDRILDLFEEYLAHPIFPRSAFATELSNVREELTRCTTQHGTVCAVALAERAFPKEALNYTDRIARLDELKPEHVLAHYRTTHTASNARFYLSGPFADGGSQVVERIGRILSQLPTGPRRQLQSTVGLNQLETILTIRDIKQIYYNFDLYSGECPLPLREALVLLRILLTGGYQSRVFGQARSRGLAYHVGAASYAGPGRTSFGFDGYVTSDHITDLFALMAQEFRAVRDGHITQQELEAAKDLLVGSLLRSYQTAGDMLGWYLGPYDREGQIQHFDAYLTKLRQVKSAQVVQIARHLSAAGRHGLSLLGDLTPAQVSQYSEHLASIWQ